MDKKITATIIVVIVVIAAVAVGAYALTGGDDEKTSLGEGRVLVYGNADNDDYLDEEDVEFIKSIVDGETTWNKTKNPYADANNDGVVDSKDVDYLQNFLDGGSGKMYYVGYDGETHYFNYPLGNKSICATDEYGLMICEVLGIYDQVTAISTRVSNYTESRYPGCHSFDIVGTWSSTTHADFAEGFLGSGCEVLVGGQPNNGLGDLYDMLHEADGDKYDAVVLTATAQSSTGMDVVSNILTAGVLFDCADRARAYAAAYDSVVEYLNENSASITSYEYMIPYYSTNSEAGDTKIDTFGGTEGTWYGDAWSVSHLPLTDISEHQGTGCYNVDIEYIYSVDPEVLIISTWSNMTNETTAEEAQEFFETKASYFSETTAYKSGMVFGVCYESMGTYLGTGALPLLASYIWPDAFDEDYGWEVLQSWYDEFTVMKSMDIRDAGGLLVFKLSS